MDYFIMMATVVAWIYADQFDYTPQRWYTIKERKHFTFSIARKLTAQPTLY